MKPIHYRMAGSLVLVQALSLMAQNERTYVYSATTGATATPSLFADVNLTTAELLAGSVQFSDAEGVQKAVIAPFKVFIPDEYSFLHETRLNLAQQGGQMTFGVGFGSDNASPFGQRGTDLFLQDRWGPAQRVRDEGETDEEYKAVVAAHVDSLLRALPARPQRADESAVEYRIHIGAYKAHLVSEYPPRARVLGESDFDFKNYVEIFKKELLIRRAAYYEELVKYTIRPLVGYNVTLFPNWGGDDVDLDMDSVVDNRFAVASSTFSAGMTYTISTALSFSGSGYYKLSRASGKETEKQVTYTGWSAGFAARIIAFDPDYKTSKDYLESLFVPCLAGGINLESLVATTNKEFAKDGITSYFVVTPFLDFRITAASQFRVGVPIKTYSGEKETVEFGPFLQYFVQLQKI